MRGHQPIIAMRSRGVHPATVHIGTDPDGLRMWRDWPQLDPRFACVQIDPGDIAAALDLRYLTRLTVSVVGSDPDRVAAIAEACRQHHAGRVIAVCFGPLPECDVATINDTGGALTWPN